METENTHDAHDLQPSEETEITRSFTANDSSSAALYVPPPKRPRKGRRVLWLALAFLGILILGASGTLAATGVIPSPFLASATNTATATNTLYPTNTATATATNTATATTTRSPTATTRPGGPSGGGYATPAPGGPGAVNGVTLGCPTNSLHPYSGVINGGSAKNEVALTFDDGPSPDYTASILSTLESTHTVATFFVMGVHVVQYPGFVKRAAADGFGIGIHTWDHPAMSTLSAASREWEIGSTANAIHQVLGANYCLPYWRPPYGDFNSAVVSQMQGYGLTTINWNDDPVDWSAPGVSIIVNSVLGQVHGGSIILMHDGPIFRWQTSQALSQIITGLKQRHLTPVTIPQLLGLPQPYALPGGSAPTPTPSATSTATPSPTPSPSPSATATDTPTPTPTDTPTPTPTDTPTVLRPWPQFSL